MSCDVATGILVDFATSNFTAEVVDITPFSASRESIDCTHQASTAREFIPSDLVDYGECTLTLNWSPGVSPPITGVVEEITFTFPILVPGNTTEATWACDGFITGYDVTLALETKMEAEVTIKWTGAPTITAEAA